MSGRRLVVEADGGSRGNPGVAGFGALVRDPDTGAVLVERAEPLGIASNNVAEYEGLIAGLEAARDLVEGPEVEVRMDSKLVVEQMSGRWKVKHEDMRRLALRAREVTREIESSGGRVTFTWVPRKQNAAADALSNVGMDGQSVHRIPTDAEALDDLSRAGAPPARRPGEPTRLLLVRHGATTLTETGRLDGRGGEDHPLTTGGRRQAESAAAGAKHLVPDGKPVLVTSALTRAVETGALLADALGVPPTVDPDWDEQAFGDWEGRSVRELMGQDAESMRLLRTDPGYARPGGESHADLRDRVVAALDRVLARGGTTIVVSHRMPIIVVLAQVLDISQERAWRLAVAPGSLSAVEFWPDGEAVVSFTNRT